MGKVYLDLEWNLVPEEHPDKVQNGVVTEQYPDEVQNITLASY